MNVNKKALEELLEKSVEDIKRGIWSTDNTMVYEKNGIQIQVVVTRDVDDFIEGICPGIIDD